MIFALILAAYTNHAGIAVSGVPVALTRTQVSLAASEQTVTNLAIARHYPLSIFPESEQRRIAVDYAESTGNIAALRIPPEIRLALAGSEKAIKRSEMRAAKKLCTEAESRAFVEKTRTARKAYLDKQVETGRISAEERRLLK